MYLLGFLGGLGTESTNLHLSEVEVEYRLACSGELYNGTVQTFDWRKSAAARVLLKDPLELFVVGDGYSYPQELCARLNVAFVTDRDESTTSTFLPDEDIIEDLCSILTLLSRRLVSPVCKVRQSGVGEDEGLGSFRTQYPTPILPLPNVAAWNRRPISVVTSMEGQRYINNNPPPVRANPHALTKLLTILPTVDKAAEVVHASRLYRAALEFIETRPDIAYLLLISVVECLASLIDYEPTDSERLAIPGGEAVLKAAKAFGLDDNRAKQLALEASKGQRWLKRRFRNFLMRFVTSEDFASEDPVFLVPRHFCPEGENLSAAFDRIYDARSVNLHQAAPFPRSIGIGTAPTIPLRNMPLDWTRRLKIPPVPWFERAVSIAMRRFLYERANISLPAFEDSATRAA